MLFQFDCNNGMEFYREKGQEHYENYEQDHAA